MITKTQRKKLDAQIDAIYKKNFSNVQIDMFDIPKVFQAGYKAFEDGKDIEQAVIDFVKTIAKNT
jgi:hypothetical protein